MRVHEEGLKLRFELKNAELHKKVKIFRDKSKINVA